MHWGFTLPGGVPDTPQPDIPANKAALGAFAGANPNVTPSTKATM